MTIIHIYCRPWYNQEGSLTGSDARGRYLVRLFKSGEVVALSPADCEIQLPHPADIAARKALAKEPPVPLSRVLEQARASELWRKKHASGAGSKS